MASLQLLTILSLCEMDISVKGESLHQPRCLTVSLYGPGTSSPCRASCTTLAIPLNPSWLHLGRTDHAALAARIDELQAVLSIHYEVLVILECLFDFLPVLSDNHSEEHIS